VDRVIHVPLDPQGTLRLADIQRSQRVDELEFYYPFAAHNPQALKSAIQASADDTHIKSAIQQIELGSTAGFMHGFIDLVFEAAGRYYLVDYKSNFLGSNYDDYRPDLLKEVMEREHYVLQYLIYTVALHRYLKHRIPDYHYEKHFGGVYYLFLRGMNPALGHRCGVYYDRPSQALIGPLERLLGSAT
jgi:exodeoxyribonuclease V beta subunit